MPEESQDRRDSAVHIARINMWQAVLVASIGALAGIVSTALIKDRSNSTDKPVQRTTATPALDPSALRNAYRWVYLNKDAGDSACVNLAVNALVAHGSRDLSKSETGLTVYARDSSTTLMVACRADHGVALVVAYGTSAFQVLYSTATEVKGRMEIPTQPR